MSTTFTCWKVRRVSDGKFVAKRSKPYQPRTYAHGKGAELPFLSYDAALDHLEFMEKITDDTYEVVEFLCTEVTK